MTRTSTRRLLVVGLAVSLGVAGLLSLLASGSPDGLESVAGTLGFADTARESATAGSPLAGYGVDGVSGGLSGGLAGVLGVAVTGLVMAGLLRLLVRRRRRD